MKITFSRHTLLLAGLLVIMIAITFVVAYPGKEVKPAVQPWPVYELPRHLAKTGNRPAVRIAMKREPVPTEDPLIWNYYPNDNPEFHPKVYELRFSSPPKFSDSIIVEGIASFVSDTEPRANGVQGYVRLDRAVSVR